MDMILSKCKFSNCFLIFSNICCRYTSELPLWGNSDVYLQHKRQFRCVPTTYVFSINEFFTISFSKTNSPPLSLFQWNERVEMNKFLCSLLCTWMIIDSPFYAFDNLSWAVSLEYIAKLVVAWLSGMRFSALRSSGLYPMFYMKYLTMQNMWKMHTCVHLTTLINVHI